jgi:hypothetical protein
MLYLFLTLFACSDWTMSAVKLREADILAFPEHIDFGHLVAGFESDTDSFAVINSGDEVLTVDGVELVSGNTRFALEVNVELPLLIEPGAHQEFTVSYTPLTFESNGAYIAITSDDPDEPEVKITLEGYGDAPQISVTPAETDYGAISIGCDNEERITIRNNGNLNLEISHVSQLVTLPEDIILEFGSLPEPPWVLPPNTELDFLVSYIPLDVGSDRSEIEILSNDPSNPTVTVEQVGSAVFEQSFSENFEQEPISILDILFVIDDSGSMSPFQIALANSVSSFFNNLVTTGADYHIGVITTSNPMVYGVIDNTTQNGAVMLSNLAYVGIMGSGMEKGLEMAKRALDNPSSAGIGSQFFRSQATLVVIFVSDEPDWSSPWNTYTQFFQTLKPANLLYPISIIGDYPSGCFFSSTHGSRTAQFGEGYYEFTQFFGGDVYSICTGDWGAQMGTIAQNVTNRNSFSLTETDIIESTIVVRVNGQISTEWVYDPAGNYVRFNEGAVPREGQTIEISYSVWGC